MSTSTPLSVLAAIGALGSMPGAGTINVSTETLNIPTENNLQNIINDINSGKISNLNDLKQYSLTLLEYEYIQNNIPKNIFKTAINTFITTARTNLASMSNYSSYNEPIVIEYIFNKNYNKATATFNKDAFFKEIKDYILNIPNDQYKHNSIYIYVVNYSRNNFYFLTENDLIDYNILPSANYPLVNSSGKLNSIELSIRTFITRKYIYGLNRYTAYIFLMNIYNIIDKFQPVFTFIQTNAIVGKKRGISFNLKNGLYALASFLGISLSDLQTTITTPFNISYMLPSGSSGITQPDINIQYADLVTRGFQRGDICIGFYPGPQGGGQAYIKLMGCSAATKINLSKTSTPDNFIYDYINYHLSVKPSVGVSSGSSSAAVHTSLPKIKYTTGNLLIKSPELLHFTNTIVGPGNTKKYYYKIHASGNSQSYIRGGAKHKTHKHKTHKHKTHKHKSRKHKRRTYKH